MNRRIEKFLEDRCHLAWRNEHINFYRYHSPFDVLEGEIGDLLLPLPPVKENGYESLRHAYPPDGLVVYEKGEKTVIVYKTPICFVRGVMLAFATTNEPKWLDYIDGLKDYPDDTPLKDIPHDFDGAFGGWDTTTNSDFLSWVALRHLANDLLEGEIPSAPYRITTL